MGIRNVADIGPIEEVSVVAYLEVGTALFEDFGEARDRLPVTWTNGKMSMCRDHPRIRKCTRRFPRGEERRSGGRQSH